MPEQMTEEQAKELQEKIKRMSPEELKQFQKQQCIFCQIVAGKVPAKKVYEDELSIAILDINPAAPGHILLLPKEHYAIMPQVQEKESSHLFLVAKYLSQVMLKALKVGGTTLFIANGLVAGQRAQHFLLHLIPRKEGDGLLPGEEKYLEVQVQQKVQQLVEKRLNELLGIKKEVVRAEASGRGEEKKAPVKEKEVKREKAQEVEAEFKEVEEEEEEEEPKKEKPSRPSSPKLSPKEKTKSDEGISLDDIAKLFA